MEDEQGKTRRNLVAFSAAIIAMAWLNAPIDGRLLGVVNIQAIDAWKGWLAALAVLAYLIARYHFEPQTAKVRSQWRGLESNALGRKVRVVITDQLKLAEAGKPTPGVTFKSKGRALTDLPPSRTIKVMPIAELHETKPARLMSRGAIEVNDRDANVRSQSSSGPVVARGFRIEFEINTAYFWLLRTHAVIRSLRLSWPMLEGVLPYGLAGIAFLIAVVRFAQAVCQ